MTKFDWDKQRHIKRYSYIDNMPSPGKKIQLDMKRMKSKYPAVCPVCTEKIPAGKPIKYYFKFKVAIHAACNISDYEFRPALP